MKKNIYIIATIIMMGQFAPAAPKSTPTPRAMTEAIRKGIIKEPLLEAVDACAAKPVKDKCTFMKNGGVFDGTCIQPKPDKPKFCRPEKKR